MFFMTSCSLSARRAIVLAIVMLAVLVAAAFAFRPIAPVDETRYVGVAWEMWVRGDFLVPYKNGEPYSHKPPLLFWSFQAGWALFGVNDWWPRLVMPLYALASLALTVSLARKLWPGRDAVAASAALILAGTLYWGLFATTLMFDVMLVCVVLIGVHGVLDAARGRRRGFVWLALAVGLGVLAKGPVVLLHLLPVAVLAFWWQAGLAPVRWFGGLTLALAGGALLALAWALPAGHAGGEAYRHAIFWGQTADRMVQSFAHRRPVWWYLPLLPLLLFPWLLWPRAWQALAGLRTGMDAGTRFCLAWLLPVLVAFSVISGKQPHYLLPLFPAFALLLARALDNLPLSPRVGLPAVAAGALGMVLLLASAGLLPDDQMERLPHAPALWPALLLLVSAGLTPWFARRAAVPALAGLSTVLLVAVQGSLAATLAPAYDVKPLAQAVRVVQDAGHPVANFARYHNQFHFAGRLEQPLTEIRLAAQHGPWLAAHPEGYAVVYLEAPPADTTGVIQSQAYRGGWAGLVDAKNAARLVQGGGDVSDGNDGDAE